MKLKHCYRTKEIPDKFSPELERPGLLIYFYLAGLYRKLIAADKATKLANLKNSLKYYQKVVEYCQRHEGAKDSVSAELSACQDIVSLLPLKINKLAETFIENGYLSKGKGSGQPRTSDENVSRTQQTLVRSPGKSTRRASRELQLPQTTVWRVLRKRLVMKPYRKLERHYIGTYLPVTT
ncbi:hypothetical protein J6590_045294 [Homalodisca vitripennis]|nr:hypothetical protein J6590_045294 [Homalodisca vitripennis]